MGEGSGGAPGMSVTVGWFDLVGGTSKSHLKESRHSYTINWINFSVHLRHVPRVQSPCEMNIMVASHDSLLEHFTGEHFATHPRNHTGEATQLLYASVFQVDIQKLLGSKRKHRCNTFFLVILQTPANDLRLPPRMTATSSAAFLPPF